MNGRLARLQVTSFLMPLLIAAIFSLPTFTAAAEWPTYQQNGQRNAFVSAEVDPASLAVDWQLESSQVPQPAWYGPAKWDAYSNLRDLHSMRNYDPAFHVIGVDNRVYYGSSVEQCVTCVDAESGERLWSFFTNGPVRVPPTYVKGKLYFGSDDGFAYCIDAKSGKLIWKFSPSKESRWIVSNGNYIPLWPVRSGVVVDDGTAYFAASLLPWQKSYLCAVDAKTGKPTGNGRYVRDYDNLTLDGPFAITEGVLVAPQGRVPPMLFARKNGDTLGSLDGGGGAFVVIAGEEVLHGPGNKAGWITRSNARSRDRLATHKDARGVMVVDGATYLLTRESVIALEQAGTKPLWQAECNDPLAMIGVGDYLFAGSADQVTAFDRSSGEEVWRQTVDGRAYGLAFADDRLLVSTDTGTIYSFASSDNPSSLQEGASHVEEEKELAIDEAPLEGLLEIDAVDDASLIGRWVFQSPHAGGAEARDLNGKHPAEIAGRRKFDRIGDLQSLAFDGQTTVVTIADNYKKAKLPGDKLTVSTWVRVDQAQRWGGIVGAVHDNGSDERGWLLGFKHSSFSWAVSAVDGSAGLTYLTAPNPFVPGTWHHVVGSYDGKEMQLYVDGELVATSDAQQGEIDYPESTPYVIGAYQDSNENYPMSGRIHEVRVYDRVLSADDVSDNYQAVADRFPKAPAKPQQKSEPFLVAAGPWLTFLSDDEAVVRWQTREPTATRLTYSLGGEEQVVESAAATTDHEARLTGLKHNRIYQYTIEANVNGKAMKTPEYECDTFFNYRMIAREVEPTDDDHFASAATEILDVFSATQGLCLDLDMRTGDLARRLVEQSRLRVIGVTDSPKRAAELRRELQEDGFYGARIAVLLVDDLKQLPLTSYSANLIVSEAGLDAGSKSVMPVREVIRLLAPRGKAMLLSHGADFKSLQTTLKSRARRGGVKPMNAEIRKADSSLASSRSAAWLTLTGPIPDGAGDWSHAYGAADNSAFANETLSGVTKRDDLVVQWIGRPGPRYQSDRSGRKPPPLSTAGRIYLQGLHRMISVDAHNGTVLWSLELPHFERVNMPRDCSNWCADDNHVFAAIRDRCWKINAKTGDVEKMLPVLADDLSGDKYDWGYVASVGDLLVGSSVRPGSSAIDFWGGAGWYDGVGGDAVKKVCSDRLFALDKATGKKLWTHDGTVVLNSTITAGEKRVWFVECRHPAVIAGEERSIGSKELYDSLYLVALDVNSGEKIWEKQLEIVTPDVALTLAFSGGRLVLVGSNAASKSFHIYNYAADDGYEVWNRSVVWGKGTNDHGTHLSRPAIVGNKLVVRPAVMNLATGELSETSMPVSGCGTYSCTASAMFFRAWSGQDFAMWDFEKGDYTRWTRLRPDCWLSSIPADGLLLAPEGGGGCSCGKWMETSLVFIPKSRLAE